MNAVLIYAVAVAIHMNKRLCVLTLIHHLNDLTRQQVAMPARARRHQIAIHHHILIDIHRAIVARIAQQIGSFGSLVISLPFLFGLAQLSMTMKNLFIAGIILLAAVVLSTAASIALFQRQKLIQ